MSRLRKLARDRECQVRIPNCCNGNPETVVLAHLCGGGTGHKTHDVHGAYTCSACHDLIDGRAPRGLWTASELKLMHLEGVIRTQDILISEGYM
jgi:hypothetical protein